MAMRATKEAAAVQPDLERFINAVAVVPTQTYVRIMLHGESRIVLVLNVANTLGGSQEVSRFFDSADPADRGRTLLKSHLPDLLGGFDEFCLAPDRREYFRAVMKNAVIEDSVRLVRVVDHMARTHASPDNAGVWAAIEAVKATKPLQPRSPDQFNKESDHASR